MTYLIAPSILSADFARLGEDTQRALDAGGDIVHFDVMDNHFVPNLTIGAPICKALIDYGIKAPIDVHLMASPVETLIEQFAKAGAEAISFHPEATYHPHRCLQMIKGFGVKAGYAINPATSLEVLDFVGEYLDVIIVMAVNPGFGGQKFIPSALEKIALIREWIDDNDLKIRLEVDGGVKVDNIAEIAEAGADTFIAGSAIFDAPDYKEVIDAMRNELAELENG